MFTGIVEKMVEVKSIIASKNNLIMEIYFENIHELRVDQSISHNGACLTVTKLNDNSYQVDLIEEGKGDVETCRARFDFDHIEELEKEEA